MRFFKDNLPGLCALGEDDGLLLCDDEAAAVIVCIGNRRALEPRSTFDAVLRTGLPRRNGDLLLLKLNRRIKEFLLDRSPPSMPLGETLDRLCPRNKYCLRPTLLLLVLLQRFRRPRFMVVWERSTVVSFRIGCRLNNISMT